jgi:O-methyltransferase
MRFADVVKDLAPPFLWRAARRLLRRRPANPTYQGVSTRVYLSALHDGRFAAVYDATYRSDPDSLPDGHVLRLRVYLTYVFAEIASRARGDFVSVGVSYGVTARVLYGLLLKGSQRTLHLVDPFLGKEGFGYCVDPSLVMAHFGGDPLVYLHRAPAPEAFPLPLRDGLAFVDLDTGDEQADLASLPYLVDRLTPGGVIMIDNYGWAQSTSRYDRAADRCGATIFSLPTGQGVLLKNRSH